MELIKSTIIQIVNENPGINGVKLTMKTMEKIYEVNGYKVPTSSNFFLNILNELVISKEIVEMEYILPTMNYRVKSLYFPKDTKLNINA